MGVLGVVWVFRGQLEGDHDGILPLMHHHPPAQLHPHLRLLLRPEPEAVAIRAVPRHLDGDVHLVSAAEGLQRLLHQPAHVLPCVLLRELHQGGLVLRGGELGDDNAAAASPPHVDILVILQAVVTTPRVFPLRHNMALY